VPEIKIRIGAAADASLRTVFRPLVAAAIEARKLIMREFQQIPKEIAGTSRAGMREQAAAFRGATAEARAAAREQTALARTAAKEQTQAARQAARDEAELQRRAKREIAIATRLAIAEMKKEWRDYDKQVRQSARNAVNEAKRQRAELNRFADRTSYHSARFLMPHAPISSMARRAGSEVLRGIGVDTTIFGAFQRNVDLETRAVKATNSARVGGQDIAASAVASRVREVQKKFGTGEETIGALEQFQKVTGDLQLGLELLDAMGMRAVTTGVSMTDLGAAMSNVAANLGDVPDKGNKVLAILDQFTVQGAKGGVEISDMAAQAAKLAAMAPQFSGDAGENMKLLGAMAQVARAQGGAASAPQAATSIMSFANTFTKGARLRALEKAGIQAIDPTTKQIMNPRELVKQLMIKSGGDPLKLNTMVMDAQAKRAIRGFQVEFNKAGGGEKGLAAVDALFDKFMTGGISDELRAKNLSAHENSTSAKVAKFQARMDEVAQSVQVGLLPALEQLAPVAERLAKKLGDMMTWAANNPGSAIVAAIALAIGRAGLESVFRSMIEYVIKAAAMRAGVGVVAAGGIGGGGAAGGAMRAAGPAALQPAIGLALVGAALAAHQYSTLKDEVGPRAGKQIDDAMLAFVPGMTDKGDFRLSKYVESVGGFGLGMMTNPLGTAHELYSSIGGKKGRNLLNSLSAGNIEQLRDADARSKFKAQKQAEADAAIKADEELRNSMVVSRYRGAPGETAEDLKKRFEAGKLDDGRAQLISQQKMQIDQTTQLNQNLATLNRTLQTVDFGGNADAPTVDEDNREG
jgi:hypothetical protein